MSLPALKWVTYFCRPVLVLPMRIEKTQRLLPEIFCQRHVSFFKHQCEKFIRAQKPAVFRRSEATMSGGEAMAAATGWGRRYRRQREAVAGGGSRAGVVGRG